MRKRTISYIADKVFWSLLILLPLILLGIVWAKNGDTTYTLGSVLSMLGVSSNNPIFAGFNGLFGGSGSVFELFSNSDVFLYFVYFVAIELLHLFVDFLLYIPRWCQKLLHHGGGDS